MTRRPPLQFLVQMLEKYVRNPRVKEHSVSFPRRRVTVHELVGGLVSPRSNKLQEVQIPG